MKRSRKILFKILMLSFMIVFGILWPSKLSGDVNHSYSDEDTNSNNAQLTTIEEISSAQSTESLVTDILTEENSNAGYDEETEKKIDDIISQMTLEEKAGQLLFIKNDARFDESVIEKYPVGGIILFSSDFRGKTPEQLTDEIDRFQNISKIPLLVGTDEEGGPVVRLSKYSALADGNFESPAYLYATGGMDKIKEDTIKKSRLLLSYGINVNFAPVCDISLKPGEYMFNRSLGKDAKTTSEYVSTVLSVMNDEKIGSVLKHFPGYGGNGDTHENIVRDSRSYSDFEENDFLPFEAGIKEGAQCILISHNIVECMDNECPASISSKVHSILRNDLGFNGVIITDDLMMKGVASFVSEDEAVVRAINAGNDMILTTDYNKAYEALIKSVNTGEISIERLDSSIRRILRWKINLGLFE